MANKKDTGLTKKGRFFDYSMLIIVLFLVAFGLVMVYSTSSYSALKKTGDAAYYFKRQCLATVIGMLAFVVCIFWDYHHWYKLKWFIYFASIVAILMILTPFGKEFNGARRWIGIGGMTFQPAELAKVALIISLAAFVSYSGPKMKKPANNIVFCLMALLESLLIFVITNNLSSAIILMGIAYIMLMVANSKPGWLIGLTILAAILVVIFLIWFFRTDPTAENFRFKRLSAWRDPESYASNAGFQTLQSLYAIGSGGFFGKGLGQSIQKLGFIPEAQNDMVFSVICEELGLFGGICLIILFMLLIWRFMVIANNAPDIFGSMLVVGVMAHISIQVVYLFLLFI